MRADLVFHGGPVFGQPTATAVAVAGGRIVGVGRDEVVDLIGPGTEAVDLRGGLLVPGFQDAHVHPLGGGQSLLLCNVSVATTPQESAAIVGDYAVSHPELEWIMGGGWYMATFPGGTPTADLLDAVVSDRPVFLTNRDVHGAWVNSRALEIAGITATTPDPPDGRIERDARGNPTGTLHEGAMALVNRHIPAPTREERERALLVAQAHLHAFGVTSWQDAILGDYADLRDPSDAYMSLAESDRLTARVVGALWWERDAGLDQVESLVARREALRAGRFAAPTVKIMQDGVAENFTAAMLSPYSDGHGHATSNSGISFVEPALLRAAVTALDARGFQVHFHSIGDRAARECLDAVEAAIAANGRTDNRHHIAHLQVVHPDDLARFSALGVSATIQAFWATRDAQMTELTLPYLGEQRGAWQYPFGDLARRGTRIAAGSDWPVSTPDPLAAIHTAVNRSFGDDDQLQPAQALTLAEALLAYTAGSAYVNHLDDVAGTIEVGKFADLAVLDRDPFGAPVDKICETTVRQTFVAGERVYAASDA